MKPLKEIESSFNNISFITYISNLVTILNKYPHASSNRSELNRVLNSFRFNRISSAIKEKQISIKSLLKVLIKYNKRYAGYERSIMKDFIYLIAQGNMDKVVKLTCNLKGNTSYLAYNFYTEQLIKYSAQKTIQYKENTLEFAGGFYQFTLLLIMFHILHMEIKQGEMKKFLNEISEQACRGILSGFEAYTELSLSYPYGALIEELQTLTSADENKLAITSNMSSQTIEFKILDNIIFQERYWKEGYSIQESTWDPEKDRKVTNIFRICKGTKYNSIKLIYAKASGQRTIGRLFGFNENSLTRIDELYDSGMSLIKNMLCFCFMAIMENCNPVDYQKSLYLPLNNLVKRIHKKGKRYVNERIAVISLLALHPILKEKIIDKYFKHKTQREDILKEVEKLEKDIQRKREPVLIQFVRGIRRSYVW